MPSIPFLHSRAGQVLRYALSAGVLAWLVARVDWGRLSGIRSLDWGLALPALLLAGLAYPLQAWRWHLLLAAQGVVVTARWAHGVFWIGQFYNSFLPGGVAGDAVRFGYLWREHPKRKAAAAASLIADRLLGLAALFTLASSALGLHGWLTGGVAELQVLLAASVTTCALLVAVGWSATRTRWWEPLSARLLGAERAAALHDAALALGSRHATLAAAAVLSTAVWVVDFVSLWLLARSVGLDVGALGMTVAAAAAYVAASLPISIGGHGVREATLVGILALLGFTGADGRVALLALAFWAVSVGWSLAGGLVYFLSLAAGWPVPPGGKTGP